MSLSGGMVLFVCIWFVVMFVVLQITTRTQAEDGEVVAGTHEGAPANFRLVRTLVIVTLISAAIFAAALAVIVYGGIGIEDFDIRGVTGEGAPN